MIAAFACPECGSEVGADSSQAGRRVRCAGCGTIVEIPFLARSSSARHRPQGSSPALKIAGAGLAVAILMVIAAVLVAKARGRANRERDMAEAVHRSKQAEMDGRFDEALLAVESALKIAKTLDPSTRKPLKERRNLLAIRQTEASLASIPDLPDPVQALRAIQASIDRDPARESLRDRVMEALAAALLARARSDLVQANSAMASAHPEMAMELCERVAKTAEEVGRDRADDLRSLAQGIARKVLSRYGVVFVPVSGEFLQGPSSARLHATTLQAIIAPALKRKGFLPRPEKSAFLKDWDEVSPYRIEIEIIERQDGSFFQSALHTTRLTSHVALLKGPKYVWQSRPQGLTRVPPPDMSAFEMSHISISKERDPALEKRLYNDARAVLSDNVATSLRSLPSP
jgi:hypothetical protein